MYTVHCTSNPNTSHDDVTLHCDIRQIIRTYPITYLGPTYDGHTMYAIRHSMIIII